MNESPIEKYVREQAFAYAKKVDDTIFVCVRKREEWCPEWLYNKVIKSHIEVVNIKL